ncbi:hypothetical protein CBF23_009855 [Marinomonas agarivorans]|nr:hypothetical protein CBF23_009855 [Marinomonas agarivorans]
MSIATPLTEQDKRVIAQQRANNMAEESTIRTLLNCYLREVATPKGTLHKKIPPNVLNTLPLGWCQRMHGRHYLLLDLVHTQKQVVISVSRPTLLGNYRYAYPILGRATAGEGAAWKTVNATHLATWLVSDLCRGEHMPFNMEFIQQIGLSQKNIAQILSHASLNEAQLSKQQDLYLFSEQSLLFGHPFHPTPKSRQWQHNENEAGYAPEYRSTFCLHWFKVPANVLRCETIAPLTPAKLLADIAPISDEDGTYSLIPVHPAQARYVLSLPAVQNALASNTIAYLGAIGREYAATASVRTLYHPDSPWFIKGSLNVRITNCVRKNAIYELESAIALHDILRVIYPDLRRQHKGFRLLGEPGFLTVKLPNLTPSESTLVQEGFGTIFRENIHHVLEQDEQAVLAGALFQYGNPLGNVIEIADKEAWLHHYAKALVFPILHAFFAHGVIFEPHLQNTVICLQNNLPSGVIIRDFEGVKLVDSLWPQESLSSLNERAQTSVRYRFEQGWNRVRYCLLINNLAEAVNYLAQDCADMEQKLWRIIYNTIEGYYLNTINNTLAQKHLKALLAGEAIPSKTNLLVRIKKHPDRQAGYVYLNSPFAQINQGLSQGINEELNRGISEGVAQP